MKRILNYPGSKWRMADLIIDNMPDHKAYLEPYFGSGAVFFSKDRDIVETINDIDGRLVNLFRVMRDQSERLQYLISHTLWSREEYQVSQTISADPVEDARRMMVRLWFGVGGKTVTIPGFRKNVSWNGPWNTYEWCDMHNRIGAAAARLKDAQIENMDAVELIRQHNDPDTLIYCVPPYLASELVSKHYKHDIDHNQHMDLLAAVKAHKGPVMISGYASDLYEKELADWSQIRQATKVGALKNEKTDRTEIVWCNFEPSGQMSLFG